MVGMKKMNDTEFYLKEMTGNPNQREEKNLRPGQERVKRKNNKVMISNKKKV